MMARPVASARPSGHPAAAAGRKATPVDASASPFLLPSLAVLTARTRLAPIGLYVDTLRLRRPLLFWSAVGAIGLAVVLTLISGAVGSAAVQPSRSALDALGGASTSATGAPLPAGGSASSLLGGSVDPVDLVVKGGLVILLLFVTLRILRRVQGGSVPADARIRVIESRTLGAKTQLHLVAIGDRQVLIGATPGRLVTLAELTADETDANALGTADHTFDGALDLAGASFDR
jgi:flagellar protein FliO/FliZ